MSLQKSIEEEMAKLAYAIIQASAKLTADSDVKHFKRVHTMVKAYKDLDRLLVKAVEVESGRS